MYCTTIKILLVLSCMSNLAWGQLAIVPTDAPLSCESFEIQTMCGELGYNLTHLPNIREHRNQMEANDEFKEYLPLIESGCSPYLIQFLCSIYFPLCYFTTSGQARVLNPCSSFCELVHYNCSRVLLEGTGIQWPAFLNCTNDYFVLPPLCFGRNNLSSTEDNAEDITTSGSVRKGFSITITMSFMVLVIISF